MIILGRLRGQLFFEPPLLSGSRLSSIDSINLNDDATKKEKVMNKGLMWKYVKLSAIFCFMTLCVYFIYTTSIWAKDVPGVTDKSINIGLIADMTGPTATDISSPIVTGLRTYFRYINDGGGIHGRKVNLLVEDDRYTIPMAISAFKKLVFKDKILALMGPVSSGNTLALLNQIKTNKIPTITYGASDRIIVPVQEYVFTCIGQYKDDIKFLFEYIFKKEKMPTIGLVYPDHEVGIAAFRAALEESKLRGVKLHTEILNIGALDATSQALNLKRSNINNIIIQETPGTAAILLRASTKLGLQAKYYGTQVTTNEDIIELGGSAVKEFLGAHSITSWYDNCPGANKLRETMIKYHNKTPRKSRILCLGWLGGIILKEGLYKAGVDLTSDKVRDALEGIKKLDTGGIAGPISYGPDNHKGLNYLKMFKVDFEKKIFIAITDWTKTAE